MQSDQLIRGGEGQSLGLLPWTSHGLLRAKNFPLLTSLIKRKCPASRASIDFGGILNSFDLLKLTAAVLKPFKAIGTELRRLACPQFCGHGRQIPTSDLKSTCAKRHDCQPK